MPGTLIIGYGNPTRGDDGIGWVAAERLGEELHHPDVRVLALQQLALELAVEWSQVDRVILIDAVRTGPVGSVQLERIAPAVSVAQPFSHHLAPAALVECTRALYGCFPEAWLISVVGESFEFSEKLSASVEAAIPLVLARVRELIETPIQAPAIPLENNHPGIHC
jgi:hydrogenase maturation protease